MKQIKKKISNNDAIATNSNKTRTTDTNLRKSTISEFNGLEHDYLFNLIS